MLLGTCSWTKHRIVRKLCLFHPCGFRCCFAPPSGWNVQDRFYSMDIDVSLPLAEKLVSFHRIWVNLSQLQSSLVSFSQFSSGCAKQNRANILTAGRWAKQHPSRVSFIAIGGEPGCTTDAVATAMASITHIRPLCWHGCQQLASLLDVLVVFGGGGRMSIMESSGKHTIHEDLRKPPTPSPELLPDQVPTPEFSPRAPVPRRHAPFAICWTWVQKGQDQKASELCQAPESATRWGQPDDNQLSMCFQESSSSKACLRDFIP